MSSVYFYAALRFVKEHKNVVIKSIGLIAGFEIIHKAGVFSKVKEGLNNLEKRTIQTVFPVGLKIEHMRIRLKIDHLLRIVNNEAGIQDIKSKTDAANMLLSPSERQDIPPIAVDKHAYILKLVLGQHNLEPTIRTRGTNALLTFRKEGIFLTMPYLL